MVETLIPKILANISYLGPTYVVLEFTNVGTIAAQNVNFSYSLKGVSDKTRQLQLPLLKVNETIHVKHITWYLECEQLVF